MFTESNHSPPTHTAVIRNREVATKGKNTALFQGKKKLFSIHSVLYCDTVPVSSRVIQRFLKNTDESFSDKICADDTSSLDVSVWLTLSKSYGSLFASIISHLKSVRQEKVIVRTVTVTEFPE